MQRFPSFASSRFFDWLFPVWQPWWVWAAVVALGLLLAGAPLWLGATLVGTTAVLILILIHPFFGLALTLLLGPWGALENIVLGATLPGGGLLDSGQLLLLLTLGAWLARRLLRRRLVLRYTFLNAPLALFVLISLATLVAAPSLVLGFKELLKWLEIGLIMLMVVDLAQGDKAHRARMTRCVVIMILLAGLSQALIGIWQFGLRGDGPEHFVILGGFYRAYGTFEQPNPFAGFMNLTALPALGLLLGLLAAHRPSFWRRLHRRSPFPFSAKTAPTLLWAGFVAVCGAAATLALLFSWSRGAWLGFGAGTAVLLIFWPRNRWLGLLLVALVGGMLLLGIGLDVGPLTAVSDRLSGFGTDLTVGDVRGVDINDANYAVVERLAHWQAALAMARHNLWLGVGFGNYEPAYAQYALINWPDALGHAHNYYLNLLAEGGVLGLVAYLFFWTAVFWQTMRILNRSPWPRRGLALGLLAAWAALAIHHLVDKLYVNNIYVHLGVMLALLQLLDRRTMQKSRKRGLF